jgi:hypothetical protein
MTATPGKRGHTPVAEPKKPAKKTTKKSTEVKKSDDE